MTKEFPIMKPALFPPPPKIPKKTINTSSKKDWTCPASQLGRVLDR